MYSEMKSCKPEPGELSSLNSSTSSKKDDGLKRDRESQELNDSEEEGDLLEDEDEVRSRDEEVRWGPGRELKHHFLRKLKYTYIYTEPKRIFKNKNKS